MTPRLRALWWRGLLCLPLLTLQAVPAQTPLAPTAAPSTTAQAAAAQLSDTQLLAAPPGAPATSRAQQLRAHSYVEQEVFLQGRAQHYRPLPGWGQAGQWGVQPHGEAHPYVTRLLVRRPADPARFNGMIVVEWLNTTPGFDLDGGWVLTREELMAQGYAWVGVSNQTEGLQALQGQSPRYAALRLASNEGAHAIFGQAGQAIRTHWPQLLGLPAPLTPSAAEGSPRLLAMGYSQSGLFLYTYINTFHPTHQVFDGFYLRGPAPLAPAVEQDGDDVWAPVFRSDLKTHIMQVQTEAEAMVSWPLSRTPDTDRIRYWEISGAAHLDAHLQAELPPITPENAPHTPPGCLRPLNALPAYMVDHAALHALTRWVTAGVAPTIAPRMARNALGFVRTDEAGHAQGGLRLPDVQAPVAHHGQYSNFSTRSLSVRSQYACIAGGSTVPMEASDLQTRYASRADYVQAYQAAADALLSQGFLRPRDHQALLDRSQAAAATLWPGTPTSHAPH
ncbi:MAG: alpha/beta hydrolase domain-containing protein [Aquabacterium sp.]|jgi:hypothetical protein|uniref:alpha/beta hydrolase domain-containing protein n=1 Tax=Aquabacterium sp. TaxID=1872578 RepID=UPI002A36D68F|nr:alpha/beta hydrolase domain-containing protein [Aquabacterium sp.]MDX9842281.1 alpha/beta hydrolase domain-containing protein [Aquabacterium sp.]